MSGSKSAPESMTEQAQLAQHNATISAYFHQLQAARAKLKTVLGRSTYRDTMELSFRPQPPQALAPLTQYLAMAYAYRPELKEKLQQLSKCDSPHSHIA